MTKLLGAKVRECVSTQSVLLVETLEFARTVAKLISEHGGTARVREARTVEKYEPARIPPQDTLDKVLDAVFKNSK